MIQDYRNRALTAKYADPAVDACGPKMLPPFGLIAPWIAQQILVVNLKHAQ